MERDLAASTKGLEVRWFQGRPDLSESPVGYKSPDLVREHIERFGLAKVVAEIQPLGSIMAGRRPDREEILTPKQRRQMAHRAGRRRLRQQLDEGYDEV